MKNQTIKTSDFILASYLTFKKIPLEGIEKSSKKATFLFPNTEKVKDLVKVFSIGQAEVEPIEFFLAQKKIKHLLYL